MECGSPCAAAYFWARSARSRRRAAEKLITDFLAERSQRDLLAIGISQCRLLLAIFFGSDCNLLRLPGDLRHVYRPERNKIDTRQELGKKRWQKFPVPAEQVNHQGSDTEIGHVVSRRQSAFDEKWKNQELKRVRDDGQDHGGSKPRTWRDGDGVVSYGNVAVLLHSPILNRL